MRSHPHNLISDHTAGWLCLGLGLIALYGGLVQIWRGYRSRAWPQVRGEIISSGVEVRHGGGSNGVGTSYMPSVTYRYVVEGKEYEGSVIRYLLGGLGRVDAEACASRYPVGGEVAVFHAPANPSVAVLEHGVPPLSLAVALACGTLFPLVGIELLTGIIHS